MATLELQPKKNLRKVLSPRQLLGSRGDVGLCLVVVRAPWSVQRCQHGLVEILPKPPDRRGASAYGSIIVNYPSHASCHSRLSMSDDFMKSHLDAVQQVGRARAALLFGCVSGASGGKAGRSAGYTLLACPRALRAGGGLRLVTAASATDRADLTLRIGTTGEETVRGESSQ